LTDLIKARATLKELFQGRRAFTEQQWIDAVLRSTGMEPTHFPDRAKWHLLARMIPLIENNYNLAELTTGNGFLRSVGRRKSTPKTASKIAR
jgi:predicted ATP-dependent Lon-type protease